MTDISWSAFACQPLGKARGAMFESKYRSAAVYLWNDLKRRDRNIADSEPAMDDEIQVDEKGPDTTQGRTQSLQSEIDALRRIVCDLLYKNELLRMRLGQVQDEKITPADRQMIVTLLLSGNRDQD
jgi:hypothetical protein